MPIRLVCPSCSASLSADDKYAGGAVKCPKCAGTIAATQPVTAMAPPKAPLPPLPPQSFEVPDGPPATPKGGKITGGPSTRRGARADDWDDGRPAVKNGTSPALITGIVCAALLTCCAAPAGALYFFVVRPAAEAARERGDAFQKELDEGIKKDEAARKNLEADKKANPAPPGNAPKKPTAGKTGPAIEIVSEELGRAYQEDHLAADVKYRGKTLVVTGPLIAYFKIPGSLSVTLAGGIAFALDPAAPGGVDKALNGQWLCIRGRCEGGRGGGVSMTDCEVLSVEPRRYTSVAADRLFADFAADPAAAGRKYANIGTAEAAYTYLHVTDARVAAVGDGYIDLVAPAAKGGLRLRASCLPRDRGPFARLKVGDAVSVKGQCRVTDDTSWMIAESAVAP